MREKIFLLILLLPFLLFAQTENTEIQQVLTQNVSLIDQFSQLAPMAINPYITVFLTSLCAKLGFHNDFVATNPFFNNWFILILFGTLFLFTALVGTVFKTNKATAPIGLADNYLSNHAALIINGVVMLAPSFFADTPNEVVYQAGFISISLKTLLVLATSMYFLVIVMSVRFFIDTLIFLSPIPFIDSILEIIKIIVSIIFVVISIVSPITSVIVSIIMFITALIFYRKSIRFVSRIKYLFIYPILNVFRKKETILTNGKSLSILVYLKKGTKKFKKGSNARIEKQDDKIILSQRRFIFGSKEEEIVLKGSILSQTHLDTKIINEERKLSLILNRSYHSFIYEIAKELNIDIKERDTLKLELNKGALSKVKNMFDKSDIAELKSITE
jgi:hypothetical protein